MKEAVRAVKAMAHMTKQALGGIKDATREMNDHLKTLAGRKPAAGVSGPSRLGSFHTPRNFESHYSGDALGATDSPEMAATHSSIKHWYKDKKFLQDLYFKRKEVAKTNKTVGKHNHLIRWKQVEEDDFQFPEAYIYKKNLAKNAASLILSSISPKGSGDERIGYGVITDSDCEAAITIQYNYRDPTFDQDDASYISTVGLAALGMSNGFLVELEFNDEDSCRIGVDCTQAAKAHDCLTAAFRAVSKLVDVKSIKVSGCSTEFATVCPCDLQALKEVVTMNDEKDNTQIVFERLSMEEAPCVVLANSSRPLLFDKCVLVEKAVSFAQANTVVSRDTTSCQRGGSCILLS